MNYSGKKIGIIGYGISGRVLAFKLAQKGAEITIFADPNAPPHASFAAQGLSSVKGLFFARSNLFGMKLTGHKLLKELIVDLEKKTGDTLHKDHCVFEPFADESVKWQLIQRIYRTQFTALYNKCFLPPPIPLKGQFHEALHYPDDFIYDSERLLKALESENKKNIKEILAKKIKFIKFSAEKTMIFTAENDKFEFDYAVLAAGPSVEDILDQSGMGRRKHRHIFGSTMTEHRNTAKEFAVVKGKHSFISFQNRRTIGATSLNASTPNIEAQNVEMLGNLIQEFSPFHLDISLNVQDYVIRSGIRLCYENMVPRMEWIKCSNNQRRIFVVSGLYKNGYQFSPLAFQIMTK